MVCCVGQEVDLGLVKERRFSAVSLCQDDFIKKFDGRIICRLALALMDKFVESYCRLVCGAKTVVAILTLCLLQRFDILHIFGWQALHKFIHLELVGHTRLLALATSRYKIASVRVEQASEASYKRCAHLIRSKCCGADNADQVDAPTMGVCATSYTLLEK
jgi:hypothetical protein